jgi:hypothetical protein
MLPSDTTRAPAANSKNSPHAFRGKPSRKKHAKPAHARILIGPANLLRDPWRAFQFAMFICFTHRWIRRL